MKAFTTTISSPFAASCLCTLAAAVSVGAQELPGDRPARAYLAARAAAIEREFLPGVRTAADFERLRPALRGDYFDMLGLRPMPERTPLNPVVTGRVDRPSFVIEKLHFQSRPGLYVTANLYLPKAAPAPLPAILYVCGHWNQGRDGHKTHLQDHATWFASHGYVALVLDTLQLGEIKGVHHGTYSERRWWWPSAGYTPAGVECWNGTRAIDYLVSRPEVDPARIGVTGMSGGGAASFWIAAADERVRAAAPLSGMADLGYYVGEDGSNMHCDCMFLYNRARWNWTTIAALVCPRPLLFLNSDADPIFPMSANERISNRLERLYARFGAGDKFETVVSVGDHNYRTDIRRSVFEFFNRHLKGDARPVTDPDDGLGPDGKPRIPTVELRVFPEDKDIPADPINTRIDRLFVAPGQPGLPPEGGYEAWRRDLLDRLRAASFGAWPERFPEGPAAVLADAPESGSEFTEDGMAVHWRWIPARVKADPAAGGGAPGRWLVVLNEDEPLEEFPAWARDVIGTGSVLLLAPRGVGPGTWTRKNPPNTIERSTLLVGGTVDGGRVWDVMAVARRRAGGGIWRAAGRGNAGVIAAYAALYEPSIGGVACVDPPPSHRPEKDGDPYGPAILNVLRVLDIPEALGCLAPRPLTLVNAKAPAFDRTAEIYRRAGAAEKVDLR